MRPVTKPPAPPATDGQVSINHLFNALGPYCSSCEMPLPGLAYVWHPRTGVQPTEVMAAGDWHEALLLCRNCADATIAAPPAPPANAGELRPDHDLTFKLGAVSPFSYALQPAQHQLLSDETGAPTGAPSPVSIVVVHAQSPQAQATLDRFALNTPYFNAAANTVSVPETHHEQLLDRRLDMRSQAWQHASEIAELLAQTSDEPTRKALVDTARRLAEAVGFWSVWATVLWSKHQDPALLAAVLMPGGGAAPPPPRSASRGAAARRPGRRGALAVRIAGPLRRHPFRLAAIGGPRTSWHPPSTRR